MMTSYHDVLRKHIGNADDTIIPIFETMVYAIAAPWLIQKLNEAQEREGERSALSGDTKEDEFCESERQKLKALIDELESLHPLAEEVIIEAIDRRYMVNPNRSS